MASTSVKHMNDSLSFLNKNSDYSADLCGNNDQNMKIAFTDNHIMKPICSINETTAGETTANVRCINTMNITSAICAYPYVGPLSIQNNSNFCETGYEPSIWTKPDIYNIHPTSTNHADFVSYLQTKIDNSKVTSGTTLTEDNGKPLWCVKRVTKDASGIWT